MTEKIIVGLWRNAPFQGAIISSVDRLNSFLAERKIDMTYDLMYLTPEQLSDDMTLPNVFILDGGEDVNPERYGEKNRYSYFSTARDKIEFGFAEFMSSHGVRLAGVCRGHQLLNVFMGGTLFQDIRRDGCVGAGMKHSSGHKVKIGGGRKYGARKSMPIIDFVGTHAFSVSSLHHQAVNMYGKGVYPTLVWEHYRESNKGREAGYIIEGIETSDSMVRGVQSHPEFKGYPKDGLLFAYLMYVDYFSTPVFEITDTEIKSKFSNLIERKEMERNASSRQYVNMSRRSGHSPSDVEETLRQSRQREREERGGAISENYR